MSAPRIEIDLSRIRDNACALVELASTRGVSVTGVTKAMRGLPALGHALLAAGASALGESRVENIERLRAGGIDAPIVLIRSPMPSQVERVVGAADISCNGELEVVTLLADAARSVGRVHGVVLMVELGDLREGIMPGDLHDAVAHCLRLPHIRVRGIGANLACRSGVVPDDRNMGELSRLAESIETTFGIDLDVVSGGNSANLEWLRATEHIGRINNLRLGESILLGTEPLGGAPIVGLHHDAATIFGEVIESKYKPRRSWGERARTPFASIADDAGDEGSGWQAIVALGHQDTDPSALHAPTGLRILGASSDHLVVSSEQRLAIGSEIAFRPGYSALVRAMAADSVHEVTRETDPPRGGLRASVPARRRGSEASAVAAPHD